MDNKILLKNSEKLNNDISELNELLTIKISETVTTESNDVKTTKKELKKINDELSSAQSELNIDIPDLEELIQKLETYITGEVKKITDPILEKGKQMVSEMTAKAAVSVLESLGIPTIDTEPITKVAKFVEDTKETINQLILTTESQVLCMQNMFLSEYMTQILEKKNKKTSEIDLTKLKRYQFINSININSLNSLNSLNGVNNSDNTVLIPKDDVDSEITNMMYHPQSNITDTNSEDFLHVVDGSDDMLTIS